MNKIVVESYEVDDENNRKELHKDIITYGLMCPWDYKEYYGLPEGVIKGTPQWQTKPCLGTGRNPYSKRMGIDIWEDNFNGSIIELDIFSYQCDECGKWFLAIEDNGDDLISDYTHIKTIITDSDPRTIIELQY